MPDPSDPADHADHVRHEALTPLDAHVGRRWSSATG